MPDKDLYEILGVSKSATSAELKSAYRRLALKWHPDKHQGKDKKPAEAKFKEINRAYEILSEPTKRQKYDQFGAAAFTQGGPSGQGAPGGNPFAGGFGRQQGTHRYYTTGNVNVEDLFGTSDPFEIFNSFFGGGESPFGGRQAPRKPVYSITLDFMEAAGGIEKKVNIEGKQHTVKIPAGVDSNTRIRFGEFDIVVRVQPHATFKRQGQDIVVDVPIKYSTAALGGVIEVPTIDGTFKLKVRSGTQPGTVMRLRGKGIKYPSRNVRGDQYVRLNIEIPKKLSRKQKQLLEEFENS